MNVYDKTMELLETRGWGQGKAYGGPGGAHMCLGQAIDEALVAMRQDCSRGYYRGTAAHDLILAIIGRGMSIPTWNDNPGRTFAEVKAVLVKASEEHDKAGPPNDFYDAINTMVAQVNALAGLQNVVVEQIKELVKT